MGVPEMAKLWNDWCQKSEANTLKGEDKKLFEKFGKALKLLAQDPSHSSLNTHSVALLTKKYGLTIWESYLENRTHGRPWRMFWAYGPYQGAITILGLEPHPKNKQAYKKIKLSHPLDA